MALDVRPVAPYIGAWIEILQLAQLFFRFQSHLI